MPHFFVPFLAVLILGALAGPAQPELGAGLEVLDPAPLHYKHTRVAFLAPSSKGNGAISLYFSTREKHEYLDSVSAFVEVEPETGRVIGMTRTEGSAEIRSQCYSADRHSVVLGASLSPQIFELTAGEREPRRVLDLSGKELQGWLHGIGCAPDGSIWATSSTTAKTVPEAWLMRFDFKDGDVEYFDVPGVTTDNFGRVNTVDPSNFVWLTRYPPKRSLWLDPKTNLIGPRLIAGADAYEARRWAPQTETHFLIEAEPVSANQARQRRWFTAERASHEIKDEVFLAPIFQTLDPIFVPPYNLSGALEYRIERNTRALHVVDWTRRKATDTGIVLPQSSDIKWLGQLSDGVVVGWVRHQMSIVSIRVDDGTTRKTVTNVDFRNLTKADITALAVDTEGNVYGGGMFTLELFKWDQKTESSKSLGWSIPEGSGELHNMAWFDGKLYFVAYGGSVVGIYDPARKWNPGMEDTANPRNFGYLGNHKQYISSSVAVDSERRAIYFTSRSFYSDKDVRALIRVDPDSQVVRVLNTEDSDLPFVGAGIDQLDIVEEGRLLLVTEIPKDISGWSSLRSQWCRLGKYFLEYCDRRPTEHLSLIDSISGEPLNRPIPLSGRNNRIKSLGGGNVLIGAERKAQVLNISTGATLASWDLSSDVARILANRRGDVMLMTDDSVYKLESENTNLAPILENAELWKWRYRRAALADDGTLFVARGPSLLALRSATSP